MTVTPLDRLFQMLTTARNAADAERLLRRLTVFQGLFSRAGVIAMTPDDMSEAQRIDAIASLCQWRVVRKVTRKRYQIDESIKMLFTPSRDALMRYLTYCESHLTTTDDMRLYLYWNDITCALVWGLQHWPEKITEISATVMKRHAFREDWPHIISMLDHFAKSGTLSDSFPPTAWDTSSKTWQDQILEQYIALGKSLRTQISRMQRRAEAAHKNQNFSLARQLYEQTVAFAVSRDPIDSSWVQAMSLQNLLHILIQQKDMPAFYARVDQLFLLIRGNSYTLHQLALIMASVDDRAAARHYFASALMTAEGQHRDPWMKTLLYRDWGQLEITDGHFQEAAVLYRLALVEAMRRFESHGRSGINTNVAGYINSSLRAFNQLEQELQAIEKRHNRTHRPHKTS